MIPSLRWLDDEGAVEMIDQTKLPYELTFLKITTHEAMARAIKVMNVRGAPAIGVAAAMGMTLAAQQATANKASSREVLFAYLENAKKTIDSTRPTAVNLFWATSRMMGKAKATQGDTKEVVAALVAEAKVMWQEDIDRNKAIGMHGAALLKDGDTVLTHCNAGSLATVQYGTALAPIRAAIEQGKKIQVIADETRPRLQGATLTAYELYYDKIPVKVISDNSSGLLMRLGKIQKIIVGADRIVRDAVFNKIGTFMVALAAKYHNIPMYVAAPSSTLSLSESGKDVTIEQRDDSEVTTVLGKVKIVPDGVEAINYAFDETPIDLISGIITEDGVFTPKELLAKYQSRTK
ncbi:MAG: 5-methylthioribose-1-phosphate isomerase [Promethearchaeota archaeon CR_4]|nr:MAG: 5-methylthioribose-1-phosphate isomerase [Candidatus Lokiarchaeota archaeon CR_4]